MPIDSNKAPRSAASYGSDLRDCDRDDQTSRKRIVDRLVRD